LVSVLNKPIIEVWLEKLTKMGVEKIVVNAHYLAAQLLFYLEKKSRHFPKTKIIALHERQRLLGTGGALKNAASLLTEPFFLINVDIYTDLDLNLLASYHFDHPGAPATLALVNRPDKASVSLGSGKEILAFRSKINVDGESEKLCGAGLMVVAPRVVKDLPSGESDIIEGLNHNIIKGDRPIGYKALDCYWRDIGTVEQYYSLNRDLALNKQIIESKEGLEGRFEGFAVVERGARSARGSIVRDSVLWAECNLAPGAFVNQAVVAATVKSAVSIIGGAAVDEGGVSRSN
jgi:NDP-sugar pyrophosphorylase family protein